MSNKNYSNIGEQIRETLEEAMQSMDYGQINSKINETVNMAMNEAKRQFQNYQYGNKTPRVRPPEKQKNRPQYAETYRKKRALRVREKGRWSSTPKILFGGISSLFFLMQTAEAMEEIFEVQPFADTVEEVIVTLIFLAGLILSLAVFRKGLAGRNRCRSLQKYVRILDGREFCAVKELAQKTHTTEKKVCKNLRKMIETGMIPEGFLDEQGTCLIVTQGAYEQFCRAQESRREREEQEERRKAEDCREEAGEQDPVDEMIRKGNEYIEAIREANDAIPGEVISAKLDRLEIIIRKIFESVRKHPEQMREMDRFMEYYLPTTKKLVEAYREFDALPVKGENVTNSMNEIENTLDTISGAFEQLLDDLFQDAAFDISSDISVLQTMLAREGYKEKDFKRIK